MDHKTCKRRVRPVDWTIPTDRTTTAALGVIRRGFLSLWLSLRLRLALGPMQLAVLRLGLGP